MKFGGSSVGSAERIQIVAERIMEKKKEGNEVVVVVSAMGDTTDELLDLSKQITDSPPSREMDMLLTTGEQISVSLLSMALQEKMQPAVSYTGWQIGMMTDGCHGRAKITDIQPNVIYTALDQDKVVVVAGFQGVSENGEITTLGRGGSDTTAVAVAAAIEADYCEIYSDVDGIYSTDPRIVPCAKKLDEISYDEMLELANLGAAVLHPRAVEYAKHYRVPLIVRSSFNHHEGTIVKEESGMEQGAIVSGIAYDKHVARISIMGVEDTPGVLAVFFNALADRHINVDVIVQGGTKDGKADFSFTVSLDDVEAATDTIKSCRDCANFDEVISETNLVKVSIVGAGMVSHAGVASKMFDVISKQGVTIKMVSTSEIKTSCIIAQDSLTEVILALHTAYGLDTNQQAVVGGPKVRR